MKTFYSLDSAILCRPKGVRFPFIVAHECNQSYIDENGSSKIRSRQFLVFKNIDHYLSLLDTYYHCHELVIPHGGLFAVTQGRLVFDFDLHISSSQLPTTFHQDIQTLIITTFQKHYVKIDTSKFQFVWLLCKNEKKISQHLVVKHAYFVQDWIQQSKDFYILFSFEVSKSHSFSWITPTSLIDSQIARTSATLRMPFNSKLNGNPLVFKDDFKFHDGLICVYRAEDKQNEQSITFANLRTSIADILPCLQIFSEKMEPVEMDDAKKAFDSFCNFENKNMIFNMGKVSGPFITLLRQKPCNCLLDAHVFHEAENAYLFIVPNGTIYFSCRRGCSFHGKKFAMIGTDKGWKMDEKGKKLKIPTFF